MPLISVVTPVLNGEEYLANCIASVLSQTIPDWEMLIIDDGSTDGTPAIAKSAAAADSRIRYLHHKDRVNLGVSKSRKLGFDESKGDFIALLDADDESVPHRFEKQLALASRFPQAVIYHSNVEFIDEHGALTEDRFLERVFNDFSRNQFSYLPQQFEYFLKGNRVCNSTALIRRAALSVIEYGFPQLYQNEDWTLWVLLGARDPFAFAPEKLVRYRLHPQSATTHVRESKLRQIHSQIEFVLSVLATCGDDEVLRIARVVLGQHLADAISAYSGHKKGVNVTVKLRPNGFRFAGRLHQLASWAKTLMDNPRRRK